MVKKDKCDRGRFFVLIGLLLLALAMVGNFYWLYRSYDELRGLRVLVGDGMTESFYNQWYRSVPVSSDANWYILPDVRLRFPYVATGSFNEMRYKYSFFSDGTDVDEGGVSMPSGFEVVIASNWFLMYGLTEAEKKGDSIDDVECLEPFVVSDDAGRRQAGRHDEVYNKTLNNGKTISIWQANKGKCLEFVESKDGKRLLESLKQIQSF